MGGYDGGLEFIFLAFLLLFLFYLLILDCSSPDLHLYTHKNPRVSLVLPYHRLTKLLSVTYSRSPQNVSHPLLSPLRSTRLTGSRRVIVREDALAVSQYIADYIISMFPSVCYLIVLKCAAC